MHRGSPPVVLAFLALAGACAPSSSSRSGAGLSIAAATSEKPALPQSVGPVSSAPGASAAGVASSMPSLSDLARRHAPLYRFNAWIAGDGSPCNKSEDYFPMSVTSYLSQLDSGSARVVVQEASGATPGTNEMKAVSPKPVIAADAIHGAPQGLAGDEPGKAPVYFHAYEDKSARVRRADGSGSDLYYIEYWLFYGQDAARSRVFLLGSIIDKGGHEGDWELATFAVQVDLGAGGAFLSSAVVRGFYSTHDDVTLVEPADLELVDDQGQPDPHGAHPVGYIAVGKHATYPEPGSWTNLFGLAPLVVHDEFFLGNGVLWRSWCSPLLDLEAKNDPTDFAPASFAALLDPTLAATHLADWRLYRGTWGDSKDYVIPIINVTIPGDSPKGPYRHGTYGTGGHFTRKWSDVKRTASGLRLGAVPPVVPPPLPVRK